MHIPCLADELPEMKLELITHSIIQPILDAPSVPGTVLGLKDRVENNSHGLGPRGLHILVEETKYEII